MPKTLRIPPLEEETYHTLQQRFDGTRDGVNGK